MNIKCPQCGTEYEVDKKDFGRFVTCQSCGKGFVVGAKSDAKPKGRDDASAQGESRRLTNIAIWICIAVLVLNLTAVITMCCLMNSEFRKITEEVAKVRKGIDEMNEDVCSRAASIEKRAGEIHEELEQMDKSRHHDAEQIYDRMGRMKLY